MILKNKMLIVILSLSILFIVGFMGFIIKNNKDSDEISLDKFNSSVEFLVKDTLSDLNEEDLLSIEKKALYIL
ncbi:MAG: hypothetical protein ACRDB0_08075, partial [Paraclostridium sp.]